MSTKIGRLGIAVGALAAGLFLAGAFVADGYLTATHPVPAVAAQPDSTATSSLGPETVYVLPAPSAQVIHVTRTATPAPAPIVHVIVPSTGDDDHDGGGDD